MHDDASGTDAVEAPRSTLMALSNAMVRLYIDMLGRGPNKAHSAYAGPNVLICTLEQTMTPAERNLVAMGEHQSVRATRVLFQYATEQGFRDSVERITGRTVRGFVSGIDVVTDISSEVFYLEPVPSDPTA
jgi:uncharacterized protein YbcI